MQHLKTQVDPLAIVGVLKECLPLSESDRSLDLHEPVFRGNEWAYVKECLDTGWVSSVGKFVDRFESQLSDVTGIPEAVAVVNGTAALHLCLQLVGVKQNDEVLLPALSFVASANAVTYCGAAPHFVDSELQSLGVDASKVESWLKENAELRNGDCVNRQTGRRIKALIAVHTFGHPAELDSLQEVCRRFHLALIEDAAEALGSFYKGKHVGHWGDATALSFNGNKIVTTGGGGAVLTRDSRLARNAKHLSTTAKRPHPWAFYHDEEGYNYRLPNLNAALGCAQLEQLPDFLDSKRRLALRYSKVFSEVSGLRIFQEPSYARSNYWLNAILLDEDQADKRDAIISIAHEKGIRLRPVWTLLNKLPMYSSSPVMDLSIAKRLEAAVINLPSSASL